MVARRYPAFVEEMNRPDRRPMLWMGVKSGYALAFAFALLAVAGDRTGTVPHAEGLYALVLLKLATNTLALWALRNDILPVELGGFNVAIDLVAMTGAIYLTGGPLSPLFAIYVIEVAVIGLLTNLGITIAVAVTAWLMHGTVTVLAHAGVIPVFPPPLFGYMQLTGVQVGLALGYAAFVIAAPTFYVTAILRRLRRKQREVQRTNEALIEAAKQKSWFMANVTHELRTPIHGIVGMSDLVRTGIYGPVTDQQKEAHESIKRNASHLLGLIDDLLALARAESGRLRTTFATCDVQDLVDRVIGSIRSMVGVKNLEISAQVEPDLPSLVTDRHMLNQVLVNLLSNAVKFTPEGGRVTLRAERSDDGLVFAVSDTGMGIPADELPHIFEAFRQVDSSDEREFGGAGLGLSMVRHLVFLLGGTMGVDSEVGAGSTFTVRLPLAPADMSSSEVQGATLQEVVGG